MTFVDYKLLILIILSLFLLAGAIYVAVGKDD